jgi:solute carrier family 35 protein C2
MIIERPWIKLKDEKNTEELTKVFLLGLVGGAFAIFMILCEFYLILRANAIILMIGGVVKELTTIILGVSIFGDKLNILNTTGVCIVFSGVILYKIVFHMEKKNSETNDMEAIPTTDESSSDEEVLFVDEDDEIKTGEIHNGNSLELAEHQNDDESETQHRLSKRQSRTLT